MSNDLSAVSVRMALLTGTSRGIGLAPATGFAAPDAASYATGQAFFVDGGMTVFRS